MFRFNQIYPSQLGRIRVLRVSDRPDRSMEVQNVSKNGQVLASLRAAKVHTITCELLVLGKSRAEITITLERVRRWLLDSGTAELQTEPGRHCLAECTGISAPEYRGLSAKVSVTFTCRSADRNGTGPESDGFTFAGRHVTADMGCIFLLERTNPIPAVTPYKLSIPGLPGTIRYEEMPEPEEKMVTGSLYLVKMPEDTEELLSQREIYRRLRKLSAWLVMSGRADLIWDSEPDVTWQAEFSSAEFDRQDWLNGRLRIQMVLQPVGMGRETSRTVSLSVQAERPYTMDLTPLFPEGTGFPVPVDVIIRNVRGSVGRISIAAADERAPFIMGARNFRMNSGDILRIMSADRIVFLNGNPAGLFVRSGDYPVLLPDDLSVTFMTDMDAELEITVRTCPRWI